MHGTHRLITARRVAHLATATCRGRAHLPLPRAGNGTADTKTKKEAKCCHAHPSLVMSDTTGQAARLSPSVATNPLLRMGRINAVVLPVLATVVCVVLVAVHIRDPTADGRLLSSMAVRLAAAV